MVFLRRLKESKNALMLNAKKLMSKERQRPKVYFAESVDAGSQMLIKVCRPKAMKQIISLTFKEYLAA